MKLTIKLTAAFLMILFLFTSAHSTKKNPIYGTWKITTGKHNGTPAPQGMMDRFQSFDKTQTFQTLINMPDGKQVIGNMGNFYLVNDTTIVTYHKDQSGKLENIANTYNFHVKNDTMHYYGFYLRQLPNNQNALLKVYIEEWWVKVK
jgi:hypothetical protein